MYRFHADHFQIVDDVLKNRVFVRDVLKISLMCLLKGEVLGEWF